MHSVRSRFALVLGVLALAALTAAPAQARAADGSGRIVFASGKSRHCNQGACRNLDVVRATSPQGGRARALAEIRSVTELASSNDGTVAVLSKDVAGGGANSGAFVQIYLIHPSGKRTAVFHEDAPPHLSDDRHVDVCAIDVRITDHDGSGFTVADSQRVRP